MKYLNGKITSSGAGSEAFQANFEKIFGKSEQTDGAVAERGVCGACLEESRLFFAEGKAIARCASCLEAGK